LLQNWKGVIIFPKLPDPTAGINTMKNVFLTFCFLVTYTHSLSQSTATFYDDFKSNKNNWLICNDTELAASLTPKGYTLTNKSKYGQNVFHQLPMNVSGEYTLETSITRDYSNENYGFGVMFGGSDPGNIYVFLIEITGDYTFYKYEDYEYAKIIPWTSVTGINSAGKTNAIKIESKKGTLHFLINGVEVNQYKNFRPKGSLHGFSVGQKSKITVNSLKVIYSPVDEPVAMLDSTALPKNLILNEEFNDNYMQWDLHAGHSEIKNGHYELSNPRESYLFWEDYAMFKVHDYSVQTELLLVNGSHSSPYGLLLGIKAWAGDFVEFAITANGFIRLTKNIAWEDETLVPWKFCPVIKSNAINEVTANRRNDSLYFYINRRLVLKHPDVQLSGNGVGWILTEGIRKVNVNYIRIGQALQKIRADTSIPVNDRQRLPDNVNSPAEEFAPVVSPDGNVLYFTRDDNPGIHGLEKDDIWYSLYRDNQWSPATKMPAPLNNNGDCGVISVSTDNQTLLLRGDYNEKDSVKEELYISRNTKSGWERPSKVVIKGFQNKDREEDFCLSNNKNILLSSIENETSLGERDLYVSMLQPDNTWSVPLNLGNVVNTTSNDFSPFLAADNTTLYYSSFGMPSFGKADIYVTRRLDDTWQNWSPPQNLGSVINTELNDEGFALAASGTEAYLSSEQNTAGKADIFKVRLPPPVQPQPVVLIYGKVFDSGTGQTMSADIAYDDLSTDLESGKTRSQVETGEYKIILPYGEHYGISANQDGYMPLSENIDIVEKKSYQEINLDLYLIPIKAGQNLVMKNLFFTPGSPAIAMKSYPELRKMVAIIKQYPTMKITIAGHTDDGNGESARYLQKLSDRRAEAVKNYFVTHGIESERIQTVGYGKDKPLASNKTDEDRKMNRRVEFIIDAL
jgi:outer membrane protein OmpA-like peptidoglycan-associated protein